MTDANGARELPAHWANARLDDLLAEPLANGRSVPDAHGGFPVLRLTALQDGRIDLAARKTGAWSAAEAAPFLVRQGDFLVSRGNGSRALVGRGGLVDIEPDGVAYPDTLIRIRPRADAIDARYLRHVWNSDLLRSQIEFSARTTAGIYKINQGDMRSFVLPLPPLPEQHRIVAAIEERLTRLDAAVAALHRTRANLKRYRAAVLAAACSGRLVPIEAELAREEGRQYESGTHLQWRLWEQARAGQVVQEAAVRLGAPRSRATGLDAPDLTAPPSVPEGWALTSMDRLTTRITSGSRDWSQYYGRGLAIFLMAQNVRPGRLDLSFKQPIDPPAGSPDRDRSRVQAGDLLVTIVGANTGNVCNVPQELPEHYVCQSVALMRPLDRSISPFLTLYMNSEEHGQRQYRRYIYGAGRPHLSFDQLKMTPVLLPPLAEQYRIVAEVERRLSVVEELETAVAANVKRAQTLRQAVLCRAFTGQLVPQDPTDEPAHLLLERIRAERARPSEREARRPW